MENASKALIIAGAILIAIVLITIGVVIVQQGQDAANNANMDDQVITTWNQKFSQFAGDNVTGSNVNSLLQSVVSNNIVAKRDGEFGKIIKIELTGTTATKIKLTGSKTEITTSNATVATDFGGTGTSSAVSGYPFSIKTKAQTGATYSVTTTTNSSTGYIEKITIN